MFPKIVRMQAPVLIVPKRRNYRKLIKRTKENFEDDSPPTLRTIAKAKLEKMSPTVMKIAASKPLEFESKLCCFEINVGIGTKT